MESPPGSAFSSSNESASAPGSVSRAPPGPTKKHRGREANVYDAVAGRVTLNEGVDGSKSADRRSKRRLSLTAGRYSSRNPKLAPEEALFRRKYAPTRYTEHDIYWANEDLPDGGRRHLPEGNLLKSVHGYASRFYAATAARLGPRGVAGNRTVDERSMDETALLAFGVLLEEASMDVLGKRGDLVFTEASTELGPATNGPEDEAGDSFRPLSRGASQADQGAGSQNGRKAKRRKVAKEES